MRTSALLGNLPRSYKRKNRLDGSSLESPSFLVKTFPIVFIVGYLSFTVALFAWGPIDYPVTNSTELFSFLFLAHFCLLAGYFSVVRRNGEAYIGSWRPERIALVSVLVTLGMVIPTSFGRTGNLMPDVFAGLTDLGQAYYASRALQIERPPVVEYIRFFLGPLLFMSLPLSLFYWKRLRWWLRLLAVVTIVANFAISVAMGVSRDLVFPIVLIFSMVLARRVVFRNQWSKVAIATGIILGLAGLYLFFGFFSKTMTMRASGLKSLYFSPTRSHADPENLLIRGLPQDAQIGVTALSAYACQGYYALSLALDKPFVPMYGVGHSLFLTRQFERITGSTEWRRMSYPDRIMIEDGWNSEGLYTTIYPWFASDVSFPGTLIIVFLIGRLFALTWFDTLKGDNPFAVAMMAQVIVLLWGFPTVNWAHYQAEATSSFWVILLLWWVTRRRWKRS